MIRPKTFSKKLLQWSEKNPRNYPWIGEHDPYKIWLSEIILQQTRSDQGIAYYIHFIDKFPDVRSLALANEDEILKSWKGLGYYNRAINLHTTAKIIVDKFGGIFPDNITDLRSLKGIGEYTSAAIGSFAYNIPSAVVDGNVIRVLSRIFNLNFSYHQTTGKQKFNEIAHQCLDKEHAGLYNQAIMNFGATQCKPLKPDCKHCIFTKSCYAYQNNCVNQLPLKSKKILLKSRFFHYFLVSNNHGEIAIRKRMQKDIWQKLYELPLIETKNNTFFKNTTELANVTNFISLSHKSELILEGELKQKLTHQHIYGRFYQLKFSKLHPKIKGEFYFVKPENLVNFAFPKIISVFLGNLNSK